MIHNKKTVQWLASLTMALLLPIGVSGCGGGGSEGTGPEIDSKVSGKVTTADGQPVSNAMINFEKMGHGAFGAKLADDGTYELELAQGDYTVTVVPIPPPTTMNPSGEMPEIPKREEIPTAYRTGSTSTAVAAIILGENTYDLKLE